MFNIDLSKTPMILLAASAGALAANTVSAAPITPAGPSAFEEASAFVEGGSGQRRPQRAKRVPLTGERATALQQGRGERAAQRTEIYERAATVDASDVQARLDAGEEAILEALA
ncbi:MAG: hypothetical protein AAFY19_07690, partial [Pseudomonadota bacterium]